MTNHQVVLVRIADSKPRCMHILACDNHMGLVQDFGLENGHTGPPCRVPLMNVYAWHENLFGLMWDAYIAGQSLALTAFWQNATPWVPAAPAWKPTS